MSRPTLSATAARRARQGRRPLRAAEALCPAVVYGAGARSHDISLDTHEFELLRRRAGRHAVIDLIDRG